MEKKAVNPWQWQDNFSFSQAVDVAGSSQTLLCAGQASLSEEGQPLHKNDMEAQLKLTFENIDTVLKKSNYTWTDIVRLTVYTTDMDKLFQHYGLISAQLEDITTKPAINLIGVNRLAFAELLVEIEVTAMK